MSTTPNHQAVLHCTAAGCGRPMRGGYATTRTKAEWLAREHARYLGWGLDPIRCPDHR